MLLKEQEDELHKKDSQITNLEKEVGVLEEIAR